MGKKIICEICGKKSKNPPRLSGTPQEGNFKNLSKK